MIYNFKKIGNRLRTERKKAGFKNMESLGEHIGASRQTIAKWESGKELPPLEVLCTMCDLYKCELGYLLCEYDYKTRKKTDIALETGLGQEAIDSLRYLKSLSNAFPGSQDDKYCVINLILQDSHQKDSLSSLLNMLVGFCQFSAKNNFLYTADSNGITPFQGKKAASGKGIAYDPSKAHFYLKDMDSMYFLKIWDAVKELKEQYEKAPDTK